MKLSKAISILEKHNKWRRGDKRIVQTDPKLLGEAIDVVVSNFKQ